MDNLEIERKFYISPNNESLHSALKDKAPFIEERYYLYRKDGIEIRFTRLSSPENRYYTLDRMALQQSETADSHIVRTKERLKISSQEFDELLALVQLRNPSAKPIIRWSYHMGDTPKFEIKVYQGRHEGLVRAEIEFDTQEEASVFAPLSWFGPEITNSPVGIDTRLPDLSDEEFSGVLAKLQEV